MTLTEFFRSERVARTNPLAALANALDARTAERKARRRIKTMLDLDDVILEDIGVTRSEIRTATSLPLSSDAATELSRMSLTRRRRNM